jgi:RNA polymerase sigma-70 factor (ECF subfamily)
MMRHFNSAYNLARWLVRDEHIAEDIVQNAYMRAFEAYASFRGEKSQAWILTIVRNTAYNWLNKQKRESNLVSFDEALHSADANNKSTNYAYKFTPEEMASLNNDGSVITDALGRLPIDYRETIILREIEGCSYKEISEIMNTPQGTVMSRLSRARKQLQKIITDQKQRGQADGL